MAGGATGGGGVGVRGWLLANVVVHGVMQPAASASAAAMQIDRVARVNDMRVTAIDVVWKNGTRKTKASRLMTRRG